MTKLLENIFRSVNIALVNELAMLCDRMKVDIWEVIDAAASKPFGFMKFQPGPGLGGHCIPVDPFYLSWKAREFDFWTEFIELAGKVNENMPYFCVEKVHRALNSRGKSLKGARVLVLGVAYKADIDDLRESPALKVIRLLRSTAPMWPITTRSARAAAVRSGVRAARRLPALADYDVVAHRHGALDAGLPRRGRRGRPGGRLPQRHGRHPQRRQRLETVGGAGSSCGRKPRQGRSRRACHRHWPPQCRYVFGRGPLA